MLTRSQILRALRAAARQLGRAPTRAEFLRLTGIHYGRLIPHFPDGYRSAIRAAGLSPDPGGLRIDTAGWCRLIGLASPARKAAFPPETKMSARAAMPPPVWKPASTVGHSSPSAFLKFAESMGLSEQWSDVVGIIHNGPMPKRGGGRRWLKGWKKKDWEEKRLAQESRG